MEISLTATIFSFFGWNVYLLIKKYRERMRQNYLQNLIDQESDYLIKNVAPYKKIKVNGEIQTIVKKTNSEETESSSNDFDLIQYKRRKTILEEVKLEKFQEQTYIENIKSLEMLNLPKRKDRKINQSNKDFSFTNQNQEIKEVKRFRKNSKIIMDDSLPNEQTIQNIISEQRMNQFDSSNLNDQFVILDSQQELEKYDLNLIPQTEQNQDNQSLVTKQNSSLQFQLQQQLKPIEQITEKLNQNKLEEPQNIFAKFITQPKSQQDQQKDQKKQQSPQALQQQPLQNNIGLFSNELKIANTSQFQQKNEQPILFQFNKVSQNQNNTCQLVINQQTVDQQQQNQEEDQYELQKMNLFIKNQDSMNQNSIKNDTNQSSIFQNKVSSDLTFGNNTNNQTNSQIGLFGGLLANITNSTIKSQDQTNNQQNLFQIPPQQTQSNIVEQQTKPGTSLFGNIIFSFQQQPQEQSQQNQVGGLFNFSSNNQTGSGLFSNLQKN